jgi:hypothetical protein
MTAAARQVGQVIAQKILEREQNNGSTFESASAN